MEVFWKHFQRTPMLQGFQDLPQQFLCVEYAGGNLENANVTNIKSEKCKQ